MTFEPKSLIPKPPHWRRLCSENIRRGRHDEKPQIRIVEMEAAAIDCPMIAHGPKPLNASATATAAPATVPPASRSSSPRNAIARVIRAACVADSATITKENDSTTISERTRGSAKSDAIGPARATPATVQLA